MRATKKPPVRCLLTDDHAIMREGLRSLLEKDDNFVVVGEAGDGRSAIKLVRQLAPDVVVMDVTMPDMNGIEATRQIRALPDSPKVLCLSMHAERGLVTGMLKAGANGYLLKSAAARELIDALNVVMSGNTYLSPPIAAAVVERFVRDGSDVSRSSQSRLTRRESQVLELIAEGCHTKEIAHRLKIGIKTVFTYRERTMRKLGLHSNVELVKHALREGMSAL